ncbi:MAG: rhodanese-like domain-containing protein [Pseudomonadota bacterium]
MNETITPKELQSLQESCRNLTILDVRRKSDFDADPKRIPGATWRNPETVEQWRNELADQEVVLYCVRGGSVSKSVSERLIEKNVNARYIEGGIAAWKESGGQVEEE